MRTDLCGQTFTRLTVEEYLGKAPNGRNALWKCRCSCGNTTTADTRQLKEGKKRDCGCMMNVRDNLTGRAFGNLIAEYPVGKKKDHMIWHCRCTCGAADCKGALEVEARRLKLGYAVDCSYTGKNEGQIRVDYTGRRFGLLTVIEPTEKRNQSNNRIYRCRCDCGNIVEYASSQLISGNNKSCGCLRKRRKMTLSAEGF